MVIGGGVAPASRSARVRASRISSGRFGLQPAILAHASHPVVEPVLRRVTARRIGFIAEIYQDLGLAPEVARRRAVITYATYLGWLDLRRGPADIVPEVAPGPGSAEAVDEATRILLDGIARRGELAVPGHLKEDSPGYCSSTALCAGRAGPQGRPAPRRLGCPLSQEGAGRGGVTEDPFGPIEGVRS